MFVFGSLTVFSVICFTAQQSDNVDHSTLDSGAVGNNSA